MQQHENVNVNLVHICSSWQKKNLGNMQCPQEHLKTIVYAKFGGQTKCIMGNSKIENYPGIQHGTLHLIVLGISFKKKLAAILRKKANTSANITYF